MTNDKGSQESAPAGAAVAVTGATGFIGRHLCDHLRRRGWEVRAMARETSSCPFAEEGIRAFKCNLPDEVDPAALAGARAVVHCAYMMRFTDLASAHRVNDLGTRKILEMSRAAGAEQFVFLSSQSAHEEAESYYGKSKFELEKLLDPRRDLILRSGLVLGKEGQGLFHRMADMVAKSKAIPLFGGGRQPLQTVHVDDLCAAVSSALSRRLTGLYTVAEPHPVEMGEFLRRVAARLGKKPIFVPFPMAPALLFLRAVERLRIPFPVSSENLLGLKCLRSSDTRADMEALGVRLRSTEEALDEILGKPKC